MKELFDYLKNDIDPAIIKSCVFHCESEFIHLFEDGNGRMGRFWQTRILMDVHPIFEYVPIEGVIRKKQTCYYKALPESDNRRESTKFIEYMLEIIELSLSKTVSDTSIPAIDLEKRIDLAKSQIKGWFGRKEYQYKV